MLNKEDRFSIELFLGNEASFSMLLATDFFAIQLLEPIL